MATYLIGMNSKFLFEITEVKKLNIMEEQDLVECYNREKQLIFACNKMDMDFLAKWEEGAEIPSSIKKIYDVTSETTEEPNTSEEPAPENPTPTEEPQTPSEEQPETQPE